MRPATSLDQSRLLYAAHKENSDDQYVGVDWKSGALREREYSPMTVARGTPLAASRRYWKMAIC